MRFKFLIAVFISIFFCAGVFAQDLQAGIDAVINSDLLSKTAVVSVKIIDKNTKAALYERNSSLLLHPASTMKAATSAFVLSTLGSDYVLKTSLYEYEGRLYLKLCGDPSLTQNDLENFFKDIDLTKYDSLIVDKTFIDNKFYNDGWMWDNLISSDNPPCGVFNLDKNLIPLKIIPNKKLKMVQVISAFPVTIANEVQIGNKNDIKIEKRPWQNPDVIYVSGEVCSPCTEMIPVQNPEEYFLHCLHQVLIGFYGRVFYGEVPPCAQLLACKQTPILNILREQNKNSNNLSAEAMFRIAAAEATHSQGTFEKAKKMFGEFYGSNDFVIMDASGLSHKNLLSCDFLCDALFKMRDNTDYRSTLSVAGKNGTLKKRLKELSLQGKTGTISGVSGLCGYVQTRCGGDYIFAILIQNYKEPARSAKQLEDKILTELNK